MRMEMRMMNAARYLFILATVLAMPLSSLAGEGKVLWWLVGSGYESLTGTTTDGREMTAGELGVTDARLRYEARDGSSSGYLTLFAVNEDGSVSIHDGSSGMGVELGVGLPGGYFGDLSGLEGTSYNFVLELGNWADGRWAGTSMESEAVSYDALVENTHISVWQNTTPSYGIPWTPGGYTVVPEPSGGVLLLLGGALLALRRKRREV